LTAPAPQHWQPAPAFGILRQMAREFGGVVARTYKGRKSFGLRFRIEGREYCSWSVPIGTRKLRYSTREMASDVLDEIRGHVRLGVDPLAAVSPYIKDSKLFAFTHFWDEWTSRLVDRSKSGQIHKTRARNANAYARLGHLDPILSASIFELDYGYMETLQQHLLLTQGLAPKSALHVLTDVRTCLRWVARRRGMPQAPELPHTRIPEYIPDIPSIEQQRALLDAIPWESRGYFLIRGLLGVRDAEAARANLEDYRWGEDENSDSVEIRAKGEKNRLLPVPVELAVWVRAHHRPGPCEVGTPLFTNPGSYGTASDQGRWKESACRNAMLKAMFDIGKPKAWRPNEALRHCFGTRTAERLLRDGDAEGDVFRKLMLIMGHKSAATNGRYVRVAVDLLRGVLK
jgi:integrase